MAQYTEALAALRDFRSELEQQAHAELGIQPGPAVAALQTFAARGGVSAFATPLSNVHASGVGVRVRGGNIVPDEFVIKVYVFDKMELGDATPVITTKFRDIGVDVEHLPIQLALRKRRSVAKAAAAATPRNRNRKRPIVGGLSIAPLNEPFVGTLGCFLRRVGGGLEQIFALSNNHVLADTNRLVLGTSIVQPGPEVAPTRPADTFAALSAFIPIEFPQTKLSPAVNRFDAAIAVVTNTAAIKSREILGIAGYDPVLKAPVPGMKVVKSGRTTGVTRGTVTATRVNGVQVNYGTISSPRIATFNDTIEIVGEHGRPFSAPGDSGSVILEEQTRKPVALLFAGDGHTTTACDLGGLCQQLQAFPI